MILLLDYIFAHDTYKKTISKYWDIYRKFPEACNVWKRENYKYKKENYKYKKLVCRNETIIAQIHKYISDSNVVFKEYRRKAVEYFLYENKISTPINSLGIAEYKLISSNISAIQTYNERLNKYKNLDKKAIDRFLNNGMEYHHFDRISAIVAAEKEIMEISAILKTAYTCNSEYPLTWNYYFGKRNIDQISINELRIIDLNNISYKELFLSICTYYPLTWNYCFGKRNIDQISINELNILTIGKIMHKEKFLSVYISNENLCNLILGKDYSLLDFSDNTLYNELICIKSIKKEFEKIHEIKGNVYLEGNELKRAILNSYEYGRDTSFVDSFTISNFYELRKKIDDLELDFDSAIKKHNDYKILIQTFNKEKSGNYITYIEDFISASKKGSPLYNYIEKNKDQYEKRKEAINIAKIYPLGYAMLFNTNIDLYSCDLSIIDRILESRHRITNIENEEVKRKEMQEIQERKQRELMNLKNCVSSWYYPRSMSTVRCFSLYYYYPMTCIWQANTKEWEVRKTIWNFKANPNKPQTEMEIMIQHKEAVGKIKPDLIKLLNHTFGNKLSMLTLVCIPSSKRIVTQRRYKDFSEVICKETGMTNGYDYVSVTNDGEAKHLGGTTSADIRIDTSFFKDKYIILFDDVITSGASMENYKYNFEKIGANVIGGISIGRTKHERMYNNPIDEI